MSLLRFVITALFATMLIRAAFANTVVWRHPSAYMTVRHTPEKKSLAADVTTHLRT